MELLEKLKNLFIILITRLAHSPWLKTFLLNWRHLAIIVLKDYVIGYITIYVGIVLSHQILCRHTEMHGYNIMYML